MPNKIPVVMVHGYSDAGQSFEPWAKQLRDNGYEVVDINVVTYESLTNEVTIKDIAEAFDRALRKHPTLTDSTKPFDAIVHSTGMLVVRAWLTAKDAVARRARIKHLIGFAPATWGSPLAHKGRGWLGAIFKGNKHAGPDFLEAGDLVLDGLELGGKFTWDLANLDLFGKDVFYGREPNTPYPFIFVGNEAYGGLRKIVNTTAMDGTVRWAGVALQSRKIRMDLTIRAGEGVNRLTASEWTGELETPVIFVKKRNHGSIMSDPEPAHVGLVLKALQIDDHAAYVAWLAEAAKASAAVEPKEKYQQFVVHMVDERGDGISDYNLQLFTTDGGKEKFLDKFEDDVHAYAKDTSYRCFHADAGGLAKAGIKNLFMRITLSSGTILVGYRGFSTPGAEPKDPPPPAGLSGEQLEIWRDKRATEINVQLNDPQLWRPHTTTMVEIVIDREPLPSGDVINRLCKFIQV